MRAFDKTITTTRARVHEATLGSTTDRQDVILLADSTNTNPVYIQGSDTTTAFPLAPGASLSLQMNNGDEVWADVTAGTETLHVLLVQE